jgi:hypothetical protein
MSEMEQVVRGERENVITPHLFCTIRVKAAYGKSIKVFEREGKSGKLIKSTWPGLTPRPLVLCTPGLDSFPRLSLDSALVPHTRCPLSLHPNSIMTRANRSWENTFPLSGWPTLLDLLLISRDTSIHFHSAYVYA